MRHKEAEVRTDCALCVELFKERRGHVRWGEGAFPPGQRQRVPPARASGGRPKSDGEEEPKPEPVLVKKAHREILDHERKRRVELKCMELQEMMEEQGYSEEEIRQKVGTFRQMLMEKEGVITREGSQGRPVVNHCCEGQGEEHAEAEGYVAGCDCYGDCYDRDSACHTDYRTKRKSSSSPSPPPKKRKKKRSGRRRSRFDSASPSRKEKKKKSGKKHKRDRSASGARKKRRYRSGSQKNKHKEKNKQRKRSPADSPGRRSHRRGSCSSRSASLSSTGSLSKSPSRPSSKHRADGHKACPSAGSQRVPSPATPPAPPQYGRTVTATAPGTAGTAETKRRMTAGINLTGGAVRPQVQLMLA
ncbi:hypothetical protein ANANG_G00161770 [Anguilla anguilla]|uniref:CWF21 domain-containing protein n=1 Tax=Anguilla anguilla TaxID=7936 RepID=A0A9D3MBE6_ANGAN|nr:hypothetical protein ANANG_G00161770 [Anguilla anguilla]